MYLVLLGWAPLAFCPATSAGLRPEGVDERGTCVQRQIIGVQRQQSSPAFQSALQGARGFLGRIVLRQAAPPSAGGIIDQGDQMAGGSTIFQPREG